MTQQHPDLADEQAYIDHAYDCLEQSRTDAWKLRDLSEATLGGTFQARYERDVFDEALVNRLTKLDLGNAALVFGRIDRLAETPDEIESFHIGRLAVADDNSEPIVVDWRAPVAEPFYRATGRESMGLRRRRHFAVEGRTLLGLEDELFGENHLGVGRRRGHRRRVSRAAGDGLRGYSTLLAALERGRTGQLGDIVATIQAEQDEIIRSPQAGVLVVQGGPGTGKTVVALHRAAYLLYTYRFPLEDQGVLVIGPNRVFLRYIERVLPSLGEAGVEQVVLNDLVPDVEWSRYGIDVADSPLTAIVKGDLRMADVIDKAVTDRERPLRDDVVVPFRTGYLHLRAEETQRIVRAAQRRFRRHNAARKWVEGEVWSAMAATWRDDTVPVSDVKEHVRVAARDPRGARAHVAGAHARPQLLHDLYGSKALLKLAAQKFLDRGRVPVAVPAAAPPTSATVRWTDNDVAVLDEARNYLGPRPPRRGMPRRGRGHPHLRPHRHRRGAGPHADAVAHGVASLAQRQHDRRRRHRPGDRRAGARRLGRRAEAPARRQGHAGHRPQRRLPHPREDHGARQPGDDGGDADVAVAGQRARRRRAARVRRRSTTRRACSTPWPQATAAMTEVEPTGSIAVVAPDAMVDAVSEALTRAGHRARPSDAQRR